MTTLQGACNPRTAELFERDHKMLLDDAKTFGFVDFKRCCDVWANLADPDGAERHAADDIAGTPSPGDPHSGDDPPDH